MNSPKLPRHKFWGAGEPDCPRELKGANGELHTMRCKVCGDGWRESVDVCFAAIRAQEPAGYVSRGSLSNMRLGRQDAASIFATPEEVGESDAVAIYLHPHGVPVPASGPLRDLGAYLARALDEDQWAHAEALLLKATPGVAATVPADVYEQRLRAVLDVVQRYLPPDGISQATAMSEIIGLIDPWPTPGVLGKESDRG